MKLRHVITILAGTTTLLILTLSTLLITSTSRMRDISQKLVDVAESLTAAHRLEASLLLHSRDSTIWELTGDQSRLDNRNQAAAQLDQWFAEIKKFYKFEGVDAQIVTDAEQSIDRYLRERIKLEKSDLPPDQISDKTRALIMEAFDSLEKLVDRNLADAVTAYGELDRFNTISNVIGTVFVILALAGLPFALLFFQRYVYRPMITLRKSLGIFRANGNIQPLTSGVTEIRQIHETLAELSSRLKEQQRNQLRYLSAIAHDLRNPIGAIRTSADLIMLDLEPGMPQDMRETLEILQRQTFYLERLVSDLLDTTRGEAGHLDLKKSNCDLLRLIRESTVLFRGFSQIHSVEVQADVSSLEAEVDPVRISQVLNNLLSNAIKYSPLGGKVLVEVESDPKSARIRVKDHGMGIPSDSLNTIFEPFARAPNTRESIPGVGIGLSTARRIIQAHGGSMEVSSKAGIGSCFTINLPLGTKARTASDSSRHHAPGLVAPEGHEAHA